MDIYNLANGVIQPLNKNISVSVLKSTGYTIGAGAKQIPTYADPITINAQLQEAAANDVQHIQSLNIQGSTSVIYLPLDIKAIDRTVNIGGDIIQIGGQNWLVQKVIEKWNGWSKAIITLQQPIP